MVPGPLLIVFLAMGLAIGIVLSIPLASQKTDGQFEKDCKAMTQGDVDAHAKNICVKNGKILFHK